MALDRDELAARCLVAMLSNPHLVGSGKGVDDALRWADALLSDLVPVAPASGAPATEPRRTVGAVVRWRGQDHPDEEWLLVGNNKAVALKIRKPHLLDCVTDPDGGGDEFVRWATREECERHGLTYVARPLPGAPLAATSRPEWVRITGPEDADYVTVGKAYRVKEWDESSPLIENDRGEDWWCAATGDEVDPSWPSWEPCAAPSPAATPAAWVPSVGDKVRHTTDTNGEWGVVTRVDASGAPSVAYSKNMTASCPANEWTYIGPATSSERAAAGLPVDAPAFDEAKEREAAFASLGHNVAGTRDYVDGFVMGWLARARVAAKEPRSGDCRPASGQGGAS